jgi:hypothetical protein
MGRRAVGPAVVLGRPVAFLERGAMNEFLVMVDLDISVIVQAQEAVVDPERHTVNFVNADGSGLMQTVAQYNVGRIIGWNQVGKS